MMLSRAVKAFKPSLFATGLRAMSSGVPTARVDTALYQYFNKLNAPNKVMAEYVWIGGSGQDLRSKIKTVKKTPQQPSDLPIWNYDGSSTAQAPGDDSEVTLIPRAIFKHPFHSTGGHVLVMCDTYDGAGNPLPTNTRAPAAAILDPVEDAKNPMFAFEQEYSLMKDGTMLGWPPRGYAAPQGPYYCSAGATNAFGREVADSHYHACLFAGIDVSGTNAEVMAGQWEYQVGPVTGIAAGDQLWISRFLLHRVAESFGIEVTLDPKPMSGDWNGAGCHINFCIKDFHLEDGKGYDNILAAMEKLGPKHKEHIDAYGEGNERRLTGDHETASIDQFSYGVANRGVSIRIPRPTFEKKRGYIEDRRPASNVCPYVSSAKLIDTILN
jgi:glutamine synthetase